MSLAQKIFRIFFYIFLAQIGLISLWASYQFFSKKAYPDKILNNLTDIDKSILEGAVLQHRMGAFKARDLIIYRLLETNFLDSVEFVNLPNQSEVISKFKLERCTLFQTFTICNQAKDLYLTSLIPLAFDGEVIGYLKLEKSLQSYDETNKKILISIGLTTLSVFFINIFTIYLVWSRFLRPETFKLLSALSNQSKDETMKIQEFNQIQNHFLGLLYKAKMAEADKLKLESKMELFSLATQVAHDIRSPLEVLKGIKDDLKPLPEGTRRRTWNSIQRIEEIAYNLLKNHRDSNVSHNKSIDNICLLKMIHNLVIEKRIEYKNLPYIEIESIFEENSFSLHAQFNRNILQRILSNMINNSVQSLPNKIGKVTIKLHSLNGQNIITVSDNGMGIPIEYHEKIFTKGFTTKDDGNGLGLNHAKIEIEKMGGSISFKTISGKGSTFYILLPDSKARSLLPPSINLSSFKKVIVLDDDLSVHELWNKRFDNLNIYTEHFYTCEELLSKYSHLPSDVLLLSDFELQDESKDGLMCIEKLAHQESSILVTARDEDKEIIKKCSREGIALLPKELINYIPIQTSSILEITPPQIVLIDDDRLMHLNWENYCTKHKLFFKSFFSIDSFINMSNEIKKDALIFIDSHLGDDVHGEIEAKRIFDLGYRNLCMATGYEREHFTQYPWIKDVIGKSPKDIVEQIKSIID